MAREFRKGTDLIKKDAERKPSSRSWTPSIYWKKGDIRTIAWLTEAPQIPQVRLHKMVKFVDDSRQSGERYETFVCHKDPTYLEDSGGQCALCDRVEHEASTQWVALALELETVKENKRVTDVQVKYNSYTNKETNETTDYPQWGLVIQASGNFFAYFAAYHESTGDIRDVAWEIHREGGSTDTKYHPFPVMMGTSAAPLPDFVDLMDKIPSLNDLLEEMGSDEHYAQVAQLEKGSQPSFGNKEPKKPAKNGTPSGDRATDFDKIRQQLQPTQSNTAQTVETY